MQIKWTEMARINLVETVIKVEGEKWKSNRKKWDRISALLPAQYREKTWNAKRQAYNVPKCETMFSDLLHAYRCKLAGNFKRMPRVLTKSLCRVLKRYEDLRNGRPAIQTNKCLRLLRGVKASKSSSQHVRESSKETGNFDNKYETDEETRADQDLSSGMTIIKWTETACLHVVKAVIQVEKENQHMHIRSSWDTKMGKWERVDSLLPPHLQGRTWNHKKGMYNPPKCASCFYNLREAYKGHMRQKGGKSSRESSRRLLSKPLLSLLKKHEDLLDITATPHRTENSSKSESSNGVSASPAPCNILTEREEQSASKYRASCTLGSASRDVTESKDCQGMCKRSARLGAYTRENQTTSLCSSERPPSDYFRGSSSMERSTSMPHSRGEGFHSNLAAPLSRLDVEFSQFGKWFQDQLIPSAEKTLNKVMTSSNTSGKRRKLHFGTAAMPIGDPLHDSQSRRISMKIRASFQQLRVQLAEDLKKTTVEIAEVLLQDKH